MEIETMNQQTDVEPNVKEVVPFFWIRSMEESLRFYIEGLGFKMSLKWIDDGKLRWCRLELGGAALMLQEFRTDLPDAWSPESKVGVGVSINFTCNDALVVYRDLISRGIEAKRPFVGNAMWVTKVTDPDGYNLFFESPTDAPEESEYSG